MNFELSVWSEFCPGDYSHILLFSILSSSVPVPAAQHEAAPSLPHRRDHVKRVMNCFSCSRQVPFSFHQTTNSLVWPWRGFFCPCVFLPKPRDTRSVCLCLSELFGLTIDVWTHEWPFTQPALDARRPNVYSNTCGILIHINGCKFGFQLIKIPV